MMNGIDNRISELVRQYQGRPEELQKEYGVTQELAALLALNKMTNAKPGTVADQTIQKGEQMLNPKPPQAMPQMPQPGQQRTPEQVMQQMGPEAQRQMMAQRQMAQGRPPPQPMQAPQGQGIAGQQQQRPPQMAATGGLMKAYNGENGSLVEQTAGYVPQETTWRDAAGMGNAEVAMPDFAERARELKEQGLTAAELMSKDIGGISLDNPAKMKVVEELRKLEMADSVQGNLDIFDGLKQEQDQINSRVDSKFSTSKEDFLDASTDSKFSTPEPIDTGLEDFVFNPREEILNTSTPKPPVGPPKPTNAELADVATTTSNTQGSSGRGIAAERARKLKEERTATPEQIAQLQALGFPVKEGQAVRKSVAENILKERKQAETSKTSNVSGNELSPFMPTDSKDKELEDFVFAKRSNNFNNEDFEKPSDDKKPTRDTKEVESSSSYTVSPNIKELQAKQDALLEQLFNVGKDSQIRQPKTRQELLDEITDAQGREFGEYKSPEQIAKEVKKANEDNAETFGIDEYKKDIQASLAVMENRLNERKDPRRQARQRLIARLASFAGTSSLGAGFAKSAIAGLNMEAKQQQEVDGLFKEFNAAKKEGFDSVTELNQKVLDLGAKLRDTLVTNQSNRSRDINSALNTASQVDSMNRQTTNSAEQAKLDRLSGFLKAAISDVGRTLGIYRENDLRLSSSKGNGLNVAKFFETVLASKNAAFAEIDRNTRIAVEAARGDEARLDDIMDRVEAEKAAIQRSTDALMMFSIDTALGVSEKERQRLIDAFGLSAIPKNNVQNNMDDKVKQAEQSGYLSTN